MAELTRRERERLVHEAEIVDAAERVFGRKGFDAASMDEIAKEAQFTRRTVYQYFANKEELCLAVIVKGFRLLRTYFESLNPEGKNGFEQIREACFAYHRFYRDYPDIFRLMNYVGYIRERIGESPRLSEFAAVNGRLFEAMARVIREGQADGSIRRDIDPVKGAYSMIFVFTGFLYQLSVTGKTFAQHKALDEEGFVHSTIELICQAIRA